MSISSEIFENKNWQESLQFTLENHKKISSRRAWTFTGLIHVTTFSRLFNSDEKITGAILDLEFHLNWYFENLNNSKVQAHWGIWLVYSNSARKMEEKILNQPLWTIIFMRSSEILKSVVSYTIMIEIVEICQKVCLT